MMKKGLKEHKEGSQSPRSAFGSSATTVVHDELLSAKTTFEGDDLWVFLRRCAAEHNVSIILSTLLIVNRTISCLVYVVYYRFIRFNVLLIARWRFCRTLNRRSVVVIYVDAICLAGVALVFFGVRRFY
jgi:hypothetical protein